MRRVVVVVMSGLSVAVTGLAFRVAGGPAGGAAGAGAVTVALPGAAAPPMAGAAGAPAPAPAAAAAPRPAAAERLMGTATRTPAKRPAAKRSTAAPPNGKKAAPTQAATRRSITGVAAATPYGNVQVRITVGGGRILFAEAIDYPRDNGRDQQINGKAIPRLNAEAVQAQSAQVDAVSGASFTSAAYRQSLQSALDIANR